jgi:hypothetical protein
MAQTSNWGVSDGSGAAVRGGFNALIEVLRTSSSGATAPSPTVGGMMWLDTGVTPSVLRVRNAANTEWIGVTPETLDPGFVWGNPGGVAAPPAPMSPAQQRATLGYGQLHADAGWSRMANGTIFQWGSGVYLGSAGASGTLISLPIAFPNDPHQVIVSDNFGGAFSCGAQFVSTSQIRIWARDPASNAYATAQLCFWAVGH